MVSRYKADGLCPSTLDLVPQNLLGRLFMPLFTQLFNSVPSSVGGEASEGADAGMVSGEGRGTF